MRLFLTLLLSLSLASGLACAADTVVVAVRHAEKASDDPRDPNLSALGQARAAALAKVLTNYPLAAAFVSEYKRTLQTAQPTLRAHGIEAKTVPVNKESAEAYGQRLAELVRRAPQGEALLVVSHSNTVPSFVLALTGVAAEQIDEATEFDRIYVITLPIDGKARIVVAKY
jgi:broad specificity phosphatase PhoE